MQMNHTLQYLLSHLRATGAANPASAVGFQPSLQQQQQQQPQQQPQQQQQQQQQ